MEPNHPQVHQNNWKKNNTNNMRLNTLIITIIQTGFCYTCKQNTLLIVEFSKNVTSPICLTLLTTEKTADRH